MECDHKRIAGTNTQAPDHRLKFNLMLKFKNSTNVQWKINDGNRITHSLHTGLVSQSQCKRKGKLKWSRARKAAHGCKFNVGFAFIYIFGWLVTTLYVGANRIPHFKWNFIQAVKLTKDGYMTKDVVVVNTVGAERQMHLLRKYNQLKSWWTQSFRHGTIPSNMPSNKHLIIILQFG